ncbi:hypothetical protein PPYR_14501 [Photinus pyralis]|uniref:Ig-like domain-containing protein n=2 Tax=Photinus pyralis TaxID=7054 RepID=A0A1Y1LGI0_PHOPY|nr:uncharacterized protein LOC116180343 [Photinus pyralis]KAB0792542.1 hypothetical protein PPYR_14501 [Photinus pyralis]
MFKVSGILLYLISASLGNHVLITQIKNDIEIPIRSSLVTASMGDKVSLHCKLIGNDTTKNLGVQWIANPSFNLKFAEHDFSTIVLYPLMPNNAGTYTCVSKNRKSSAVVDLFVIPGRTDYQKEIREMEARLAQVHNTNFDRFANMMETKTLPPMEFNFLKERKLITSSTYTTFKQLVYIVPVTILLILSLVRFCYYLGNRSQIPWQQLNTPITSCEHQICAYRRRTNPAAPCILSRTNRGLSVLIIQRAASSTSDSATNLVTEEDAPPAYNDVNADSPPTYTEAVETMDGALPCATPNSNASI